MIEPQSPALFVLLIAMFGVLMWRTLVTRRTAFRVLAACLAFVPAMVFGVLAVNKYYGYYQTWGAMAADLTQQGPSAASGVPDVELAADSRSGTLDGSRSHLKAAQRQGKRSASRCRLNRPHRRSQRSSPVAPGEHAQSG